MKRKRSCLVSVLLLCGFCLLGNGNIIQAAESKLPAVSDLKDLLNLVIDVPTNVSISAIGSWKRYPLFPLSTPEQIDAAVDREIARFKKRDVIHTPEQEAKSREQIRGIMTRYATNVGMGKYAEYYYGNRLRMDRLLYRGTNVSLEKFEGTNAGVGDINAVNTSLIVLNTKALSDVPIIRVSHLGKSAIKTVVNTVDEPPILHNILQPDPSVSMFLCALLGKLSSSQPGMAVDSVKFDDVKAVQLINGASTYGTKVSMESSVTNGVTNRLYVFTSETINKSGGVIKDTNHIRVEIETVSTANCAFFTRVLADMRIRISSTFTPSLFIDEKWEHGSNCIPVKYSESNRRSDADGYDYNFDHISIGKIETSEVASLFFDEYPKDYFYEDASSVNSGGKREVVNLPKGLGPIKDVDGAYAPEGIKGRLARMWGNSSGKKIIVLGFLALNFAGMIYLIIRKKVKG